MITLTPEKPPYYENVGQIKKYLTKLNQTGTAAPEATVIKNSLAGTVTTTRSGTGNYTIESSQEEITEAKTILNYTSIIEELGSFALVTIEEPDTIRIRTFESQSDGTYIAADGYLNNFSLEITVYN